MIVRSEYSLREAFGPMEEVVARLPPWGGVIADTNCWGHVDFVKCCERAGKKAVLGARVRVVGSLNDATGKDLVLIPKSREGLRLLYNSMTLAYSQKHYVARLTSAQLPQECHALDQSMIFTTAGRHFGVARIASCDNFYPCVGDRRVWQVMLGRFARVRPGPMHITSEAELRAEGATKEQLAAMRDLVESCDTPLPKAENIRFGVGDPDEQLAQMCWQELAARGLNNPIYAARLEKELKLIHEKKFADYFLVISDMIRFAKTKMLVGPARGSSAGSLVCWLSRITEIDPIPHGLIFERFVDVNRLDLPDIDIDFPDNKRHLVVEYLSSKYGHENVAHIGTVIRYKPKSALTDVAKELRIPLWELDKLKDVMIERSSGDSRAGKCLLDAIDQLDVGRALVRKYPELSIAARLEEHAKTAGKHAAGIVVCNGAIKDYCAVADDIVQLDKHMAERINMLKIDALGLRTLTVIEEACALAGIDPFSMYSLPLDDPKVFEVFNQKKFAGIFQFEGIALQQIAAQIHFDCFNDVAAVTALARPGPLSSGETNNWIQRKMGKEPVTYMHPMLEPYSRDTYGCILYQEQVMRITREMGSFSWADTSAIRKLMSAREGNEKFARYEQQFVRGAINNGIKQADAVRIWKAINTMGSWSFNLCIAGGTKIRLADVGGNSKMWTPIEELYQQYRINPSPWIKQRGGKLPRVWALRKSGRAFPARPLDVVFSGRKRCVELRFEDGTKISCTKEHKFIINGRWATAGTAKPSDAFTNVLPDPLKMRMGRGRGHALGKRYEGEGFPKGARNPAWTNGRSVSYLAFRKKMRGKPCDDCGKKHRRMETHHEDMAQGRRSPDKLLWLCPGCHKRRHYAAGRTKRGERGMLSGELRLKSMKYVGWRDTYDLVMPAPDHNFVVEGGVVTHNSHAVSYGLLSYWCGWLKAYHPLPLVVAGLRHARDNESTLTMLREAINEGFKYVPFDRERSEDNWTFQGDQLLGGMLCLPGLGAKTARDIMVRRKNGMKLTPRQEKLLSGTSKFAEPFPARSKFGHIYDDPSAHLKGGVQRVNFINELDIGMPEQTWVVIGRLLKKNLRDLNDVKYVTRRGGRMMPDDQKDMLLFDIEDDTGRVLCCIRPGRYQQWGKAIVETAKLGQWFALRGRIRLGFQLFEVTGLKWLNDA